MNKFFVLGLVLIAFGTLHAAEADRFITRLALPSGQTVVVAEGDFEPRSIGSFSVRLYDAASPGDETSFFSSGHVRGRDGAIEKVVLANVVGDPRPEIVVIIRSVGTGSYLSAQVFGVDNKRLTIGVGVEGLQPNIDLIEAIRQSNTNRD